MFNRRAAGMLGLADRSSRFRCDHGTGDYEVGDCRTTSDDDTRHSGAGDRDGGRSGQRNCGLHRRRFVEQLPAAALGSQRPAEHASDR